MDKRQESTPDRWSYDDLESAAERMRRVLDQTFAGLGAWPILGPMLAPTLPIPWVPPTDIEETNDAYVLEAELPGVSGEDVELELMNDELTISGESKRQQRDGSVLRRTGRQSGRFEYRVKLPQTIDGSKVEASLKDGVLKVTVPKAQPAQRTKIDVKAS
jgi:HSP20 family protein